MTLRVGWLQPHLEPYGGIRIALELGNRIVAEGHELTFFVPSSVRPRCSWMTCHAEIASIDEGVSRELDVLVFNHEPQWFELARFERARSRLFFVMGFGGDYGKPGSWESLRAPVEARVALSGWLADRVDREIGERPEVVLPGVDRGLFQPVEGGRRVPLLCLGEDRPGKSTELIAEAARLAGVAPARLSTSSQSKLARTLASADAFVVGSRSEGFGLAGLEALACGVPLVTTENGGSREYAVDGETALVVPVDDVAAMSGAIRRLREDEALRERLVRNGLERARAFDWDGSAAAFAQVLERAASAGRAPDRPLRPPEPQPELSIVVPVRGALATTQACVETLRTRTDVLYELVLVDNGSEPETATYLEQAADVAVRNESNLGFAGAMNQGLAQARGRFVAFCNNDIVVPEGWASRLVESAGRERAAIVAPAITRPAGMVNTRAFAGTAVRVVERFTPPPPAVVYVLATDLARRLGGFDERYEVAAAEDTDLAFTVWANGLEIDVDERVLVEHRGGVTAVQLPDWQAVWRKNRERFLARWMAADPKEIPRVADISNGERDRLLAEAREAARDLATYFAARDRLHRRLSWRAARQLVALAGVAWPVAARILPPSAQARSLGAYRRLRSRVVSASVPLSARRDERKGPPGM